MEKLCFPLRAGLGAFAVFAVSLALGAAPARAQLVANGGFENDTSGNGDYFAGWTLSGNADDTSTPPNTFVFGNPHSGDLAAWLGPVGSDGFLSQTVATTPGQNYTVSFWLAVDTNSNPSDPNFGLSTPNDFSASFGGQSLFSQSNLSATDGDADSADDYTLYSFTAVAAGTSSVLQFGFRDDPAEFRLDDVSVTPAAVPEASTTVSLGLLLALGGLTVIARRKQSIQSA